MLLMARWALVALALALASCRPAHSTSPAAARPPIAPPVATDPPDKEGIAPEAATGWRVVAGVRAERQMAVAANPHAAEAGIRILREGGSAVDAAIAMALVLTLVEPQSSGIGGGAFLLHWGAKERRLRAYDGRETAPAAATADMFLDAQNKPRSFFDAVVGGLSVGVPGELRAFELAHKAHGKLPWKALFGPAIELCESGFAISPRLHALLSYAPKLAKMPPASQYFYAGGKPKPIGEKLLNRELAAVLRAVADGGADAFYEGAIANDIVAAVRRAPHNPGRITAADMKGYRAVEREPVCARYRAFRACGMPPPTSGVIAALQILGLLERFELRREGPWQHLFVEASKLAYADRDVHVADPDFVDVPVARLLDPAYLAERSQAIDPSRAMGEAAPGSLDGAGARWAPGRALELPSTTHLAVVDADGNAVSLTATIESAFGSHLMVRGFLLNNQLTDFSFLPEVDGKPVANRVEPKKRPRSSMAPMVVLDQKGEHFVLAVGSPGGSRIIDYVARVLVGVLDFKLDPQTAIAMPNLVNRNGPTELEAHQAEAAWVAETKASLEKLGHEVQVVDLNSGLHAILRLPDGSYAGGVDPRREGVALGD
jgi:gamma-glutamyltranspeptidase/glutathione hydrolase